VHEATIDDVLAGSGPVAVTVRIPNVNPGEWEVHAKMLPTQRQRATRTRRGGPPLPPLPIYRAAWSWRRWRMTEGPSVPVSTCSAALAPAPGLVTGSWAALSLLGIIVALVVQRLVIAADDLPLRSVLPISLAAAVAGVVGAKLWYVVLQRRHGRWDGWCIQGLVLGLAVVAPLLLAATDNPIGSFFDASAPGMLIGMAIGRLGCFFAGCCCGRPTASRWGVWSSDRRPVGARRIPTQLLESGFTMAVGLATMAAVLRSGPAGGAWFVAGIATYTIGRQAILRWRDEEKSHLAGLATAAIAVVVLLVDLTLIATQAV